MGHLRRVKKILEPELYDRQYGRERIKAIKKRTELKVIAVISADWLAKRRKKILQKARCKFQNIRLAFVNRKS